MWRPTGTAESPTAWVRFDTQDVHSLAFATADLSTVLFGQLSSTTGIVSRRLNQNLSRNMATEWPACLSCAACVPWSVGTCGEEWRDAREWWSIPVLDLSWPVWAPCPECSGPCRACSSIALTILPGSIRFHANADHGHRRPQHGENGAYPAPLSSGVTLVGDTG